MRVSVLTKLTAVEEILDDWWSLYIDSNKAENLFLSPQWVMQWFEHDKVSTPYFVCFYEQEKLVGISPLCKAQSFLGLSKVEVAGMKLSQYQNICLCAERHLTQITCMIIDHFQECKTVDLLSLKYLTREVSSNFPEFANIHPSDAQSSLILDLEIDDYYDKKKRSIVRGVSREANTKLRKLEALGEVTFKNLSAIQFSESGYFNKLINWKLEWLNDKAIWSGFYHKGGSNFLKRVMQSNDSISDNIIAHILSIDGVPIGVSIGFVKGKTFYGYATAYDPKFLKLSIGTIVISKIFKWMNENGLNRYDFLGYPEPYKERFSNENVELFDLDLAFSIKANLLLALKKPVRCISFKKVFSAIPHAVRNALIRQLSQN